MLTFWQSGYEPTSIVDLTTAMGITAPSLYAAFGDKKRLFLEAVGRYAGDPEMLAQAIAQAPTSRDAAGKLLSDAAIAYTGDASPKGCLLASSTASGSAASADVQAFVSGIRRRIQAQLQARIGLDVADGRLPRDADAAALAAMVMAVIQGMSVLARDGASRASLLAVAEQSLKGWPEGSRDI